MLLFSGNCTIGKESEAREEKLQENAALSDSPYYSRCSFSMMVKWGMIVDTSS